MKLVLAALAAIGVTATSPAVAASSRPDVQHFGMPPINGNPAPFSKAVRAGDILYLSGVIGRAADGKVPDGIEAQTKLAMNDIGATLKGVGLRYSDIVRCTVFLTDMKMWPAFNTTYVSYFSGVGLPARSALGVNALALPGALVEIECQAYAGSR